jgi:hypothetical protein
MDDPLSRGNFGQASKGRQAVVATTGMLIGTLFGFYLLNAYEDAARVCLSVFSSRVFIPRGAGVVQSVFPRHRCWLLPLVVVGAVVSAGVFPFLGLSSFVPPPPPPTLEQNQARAYGRDLQH